MCIKCGHVCVCVCRSDPDHNNTIFRVEELFSALNFQGISLVIMLSYFSGIHCVGLDKICATWISCMFLYCFVNGKKLTGNRITGVFCVQRNVSANSSPLGTVKSSALWNILMVSINTPITSVWWTWGYSKTVFVFLQLSKFCTCSVWECRNLEVKA